MKEIILKQIKIEGFYGQTRTVDFSPTETVIRGDVKLGKTTIINAFMWCLLGVDLEGRLNYMLYEQGVEYSRDCAGRASVVITLDIDGREVTIERSAKQKWQRDKNTDRWIKSSSDEYHYLIDDLELTKTEFDMWIETSICPLRKLSMVANIDHWKVVSWRILREHFQSLVGEITPQDFQQDYSSVIGVINEVGIEKARQEFQSRATKYDKLLEKLAIEEEANKRNFIDNGEIDLAGQRIDAINAELDEIDRKQASISSDNAEVIAKRESIAKEIDLKEKALRTETETYNDTHNKRIIELRMVYNTATTKNASNARIRETNTRAIKFEEQQLESLENRLKELRVKYREANARIFDGVCPTCGRKLMGDSGKNLGEEFEKSKEACKLQIKQEGKNVSAQITECKTRIGTLKTAMDELVDENEEIAINEYRAAQKAFIPYLETERGKYLSDEITALKETMPKATWAEDVERMLHRKGELRLELQKQHEVYGLRLSNKRTEEMLEQIARERKSTVQAQIANAKSQRLVWEYERELAEIIRFRTNKLFPDRTEVVMSKYKKNGDVDFDVCQVEINGKDATATNTADRMNAGIDISTVFMRFHGINFPLFVDGAESNTSIETYGRQLIKTVVDKDCKELTIDLK